MAAGAYPRAMLVVTTDTIPGYDIVAVFGTVTGSATVRIVAHLMPPDLDGMAAMMVQNRRDAIGRIIGDAMQSHANAVVGMRMDSIKTDYGIEHCAYGTAVWAVPVSEDAKRLYDAMVHEGRVPPLSQYDDVVRRINATID